MNRILVRLFQHTEQHFVRLCAQHERAIQTTITRLQSVEEQVAEQRKRNEEVRDMPELVRDFLDPGEFFNQVKNICGIEFFCGVPDSLLKGKAIEEVVGKEQAGV